MANIGFGLQMTVLGMGLVFLLLAVLWGLLTVLLRLDNAAEESDAAGEEEAVSAANDITAQPVVRVMADEIEPEKLAAITIAVLRHRAVQQGAVSMNNHHAGTRIRSSGWVVMGRLWQYRSWQQWG